MKLSLKLVNDERKSKNILSAKGCPGTDKCTNVDASTCPQSDFCSYDYSANCSKSDSCGTDNF